MGVKINRHPKSFQQMVEDIKRLHTEEFEYTFEDKVGEYRETLVDMALWLLKYHKKIRSFIKYPKWSNQDLLGIDFAIFLEVNGEPMRPFTISVLGPKYVEKEKELHPDVQIIFPVEMKTDSVESVMKRLEEIIVKQKAAPA